MTETLFLDRPEGRISYDVTGPADGPLVVASPGLGDLRSTYDRLVPLLVAAGARVATVDLRGMGESSARWPSYAPKTVAGDLLALVAHLGGPAVLIASSYSGGAAVLAAAREPAAVRALVLSGAFVRDLPLTRVQRSMMWLVTRPRLGRALWLPYWSSLFVGTRPDDLAVRRAELKANLAEPGRADALRAMLGSSQAASEAALGRVGVPALVVMGTKDPDFPDPAAEARRTADALGGPAEVLLAEGAGHYAHVEQPALVAAATVPLLTGQPCRG